MCVVTQVLDRVARELRDDARRLEAAAINTETEVGPSAEEKLRLLLRDVRAVAARARQYAKQMDGKD